MTKTSRIVILLLVFALLLSGCASNTANSTAATAQNGSGTGRALTLNEKLAPGILKLEGTDLAVTAAQAKDLLPLWKAVKGLSSSSTASSQELEAVYQQIQDTLTAEQLDSIQNLDLSGQNLQDMMSQYGIEMPNGGSTANLTESEKATRVAGFQSRQNNSSSGGGAPAGGGMPSGGSAPSGEMPSGGDMGGGNFTPPDQAGGTTQSTPQAGQTGGRGGGMGMSSMFIDPLITLLETRSAE